MENGEWKTIPAHCYPALTVIGNSWNVKSAYSVGECMAYDFIERNRDVCLGPGINIKRTPFCGRNFEYVSEDPYLAGVIAKNYIEGLQDHGIGACVKHFAANNREGDRIINSSEVDDYTMHEVYLKNFKIALEAKPWTLMCSYNKINGVYASENIDLLENKLRKELNYNNVIVSDWFAVQNRAKALKASLDIDMPTRSWSFDVLKKAYNDGFITMKEIDASVKRILELINKNENAKQHRYINKTDEERFDECVKIAEDGIVLLKNDGILPLDEVKCGKVAIIGNNAFESFKGDYIGHTENYIDFLDGMKMRLGKDRVLYAKGCDPIIPNVELLEEAVKAASEADIVFLVLGDEAVEGGGIGGGRFKNTQVTCGEGYDTTDLNFPPSQKQLFDEIIKLHKPVVLIMYAGRPFTIMSEVENVNAYMHSFGAGEQSGVAFANLIFGDKTPSAKLAVSFPQSNGRDYITSTPDAWLPFGYGLSYNEMKYSNLTAKVENGKAFVKVDVENCGKYEIDESVLLFVKMLYCPITPFVKKLRAFRKVNLKAWEKKTVEFVLSEEDFTYIDENMQTAVNHGKHKILIENLECEIEY